MKTTLTRAVPSELRQSRQLGRGTSPALSPPARLPHRFGTYALVPTPAVGGKSATSALALQRMPIQRALSDENVNAKADRFQALHDQERQHHDQLNALLATYSHDPSHEHYTAANDRIKLLRGQLDGVHNEMADLTAEYSSSANQGLRRTFMQRFVGAGYDHALEARFKDFTERTELDEEDENALPVHKNRFLAHSLQNLKFAAGRGRFNELMDNIDIGRDENDPKRKIKIATMGYGAPKAGVADEDDIEKGHKTDARDNVADLGMLNAVGGNLTSFVARKRLAGDHRQANPNRTQIGDLKVLMDRGEMVGDENPSLSTKVVPMYYGHNANQEVEAYTAPLHTAIHHELGHLTNSLKGVEGPAADPYTGGLVHMTNEEELYNIHLDTHSDQVLSTEMHLPTRIAHKAFGGLDSATPDLPEDLMGQDLGNWDQRTHNIETHKQTLLQAIKQSVDSAHWGRHASSWFRSRPDTVGTIRDDLNALPDTAAGKRDSLEQIRQHAINAHAQASDNRKQATTDFYNILRTMDLSTSHGIQSAIAHVNIHRGIHLTAPV